MPHNTFSMPTSPIDFSNLSDIVVHEHGMPTKQEVMDSHHVGESSLPLIVEDSDFNPEKHQTKALEITLPEEGEYHVEEYDGDVEGLPEEVDLVISDDDGEVVMGIDFDADLPGGPKYSPDPHIEEESSEDDISVDDSDSNDAKSKSDQPSKKDKWDWKAHGLGDFVIWVRERFDSVPKHTGYDISGLERAHAYLERLHSEISKAMRSDLDGELDANMISEIHDKIDEGIEKLEDRIEKVKKSKSKKKTSSDDSQNFVKEAQKIFGVQNGVVVTVPLFISSLARVLVNGMVSSGKDIEENYKNAVKKYKLNDRERIELIQLLQDMGMPMIRDRGLLPEDGLDLRSTDNPEYLANYQA